MCECFARCMYVYHICAWFPPRSEELWATMWVWRPELSSSARTNTFNHWAICLTHRGRKCQIHYFYQPYLPPCLHMDPSLCTWWIKIVLGSSYKPCIWLKRGCPTLLMMSVQATLRRVTGSAWLHQWQKSQDLSNYFLALGKGPDLRTLSICKTSKRWKNIQSGRCQWACQRVDHRISWNPSNFSSQNL